MSVLASFGIPMPAVAASSRAAGVHAWRLGDLLAGVADAGEAAERQIASLTRSCERVHPGSLFFADGAAGLGSIEDAVLRGAAAVLADPTDPWPIGALATLEARSGVPVVCVPELARRAGALAARFFGDPSANVDVLAVAGNGSADLSHLLAQALSGPLAAGRACGLISSRGSGFPGELREGPGPNPDPVSLQATLADLRARGASAAALEIPTGHAGTRGHLDWDFAAVRINQIVYGAGTCAQDAPERDASPTADRRLAGAPGTRWAILDLDDPDRRQRLADLDPAVRIACYALGATARPPARCDLWLQARAVEARPNGLRITVATAEEVGQVEVPLIGMGRAADLLAVLAVLLTRDLPLGKALRELARVRPAPGRMESFGGDGAPLVVVDDAHTPDALEKALSDLRLHRGRRVIAVLGWDGARDRGTRPLLGAVAERLSDALILADDRPRTADGNAVVADILGGVSRPDAVRVERQRGLAIRRAIALAGADDAVLVAGRGSETTRELGGLTVHFSDRAQVVEALREWREGHH